MGVAVNINFISGLTEPYNIYVCQPDGTSCFYMVTILDDQLPYNFNIPDPYNVSSSYMVKIIDNNGNTLTGISNVP